MLVLLQNYSIEDIAIFIVILALATKSIITFFDWAKERVQKVFNR